MRQVSPYPTTICRMLLPLFYTPCSKDTSASGDNCSAKDAGAGNQAKARNPKLPIDAPDNLPYTQGYEHAAPYRFDPTPTHLRLTSRRLFYRAFFARNLS